MEKIEARLKSLILAKPTDELRARVLSTAHPATRAQPSEWKRLQHTMEWCAATLIAVYGWAFWFERGSEEIRQGLRTTTYAAMQVQVEEQMAETLPDPEEDPLRSYLVAQRMTAYSRPFEVETDGMLASTAGARTDAL